MAGVGVLDRGDHDDVGQVQLGGASDGGHGVAVDTVGVGDRGIGFVPGGQGDGRDPRGRVVVVEFLGQGADGPSGLGVLVVEEFEGVDGDGHVLLTLSEFGFDCAFGREVKLPYSTIRTFFLPFLLSKLSIQIIFLTLYLL